LSQHLTVPNCYYSSEEASRRDKIQSYYKLQLRLEKNTPSILVYLFLHEAYKSYMVNINTGLLKVCALLLKKHRVSTSFTLTIVKLKVLEKMHK